MGFLSNLGTIAGFGGGNTGSGFQATQANLANPVTADQVSGAYQGTQRTLEQQQAFVNALMGQNGLANQSSVFGQQQALAGQLQGMANGTGPNPALDQLNQQTSANTANQAALMASARGSNANAGLIARQAAMQGGANQQNAVGQAATLQAQQQLGAISQLQNQQQSMGNLATTQVGQQGSALSGLNQFQQSEQQNLLNATAQKNSAEVAMQSNMNSTNAGIQGINAQGQQALLGGMLKGVASGISAAHGGQIPCYADGGSVDQTQDPNAPKSFVGKFFQSFSNGPNNSQSGTMNNNPYSSLSDAASSFGKGLINKIGTGFGNLFAPDQAENLGGTSLAPMAQTMMQSRGGKIPGKANVSGDSYSNDTVNAKLSPGEIVIPRSVVNSNDPVNNAARFVAAVIAHKTKRLA